MKRLLRALVLRRVVLSFVLFLYSMVPGVAGAEMLTGRIGQSSEWGSSWIDFGQAASFRAGDTLRIHLETHAAKCVLVRLLPRASSYDSKDGIVDQFEVKSDGHLDVMLAKNYNDIKQISVHGNEPWGRVLCPGNGPARLVSIELIAGRQRLERCHLTRLSGYSVSRLGALVL